MGKKGGEKNRSDSSKVWCIIKIFTHETKNNEKNRNELDVPFLSTYINVMLCRVRDSPFQLLKQYVLSSDSESTR